MIPDLQQAISAHDVTVLRAGLVDLDSSMLFMLVLFLILFVLLNKILFQPMLVMFEKRHALTDGAREQARDAIEKAEKQIAQYETRVGDARRDAIAETKRIRAEATQSERALIQSVRDETQAEIDAGVTELNAQAKQAEGQLESQAADLGKRIAAQVLGGAA